jgi:UDP-2-acetamido-3-amino-2,3-dideoxy-glucuronate N-acetyltransferase
MFGLCHQNVGKPLSAEYNYSNLNVAVIGCGNWGKNHVRVFHSLGALYTICDTEPNQASALGKQFTTPVSSLEEILASRDVDACVIATPANTHFDIARRCLEANKHIFVEKPLATESHHAESLLRLSIEMDRILMIGHLLHYHEGFNVLKRLVHQGRLGNIFHIVSNRFTFGKLSSENNVLWDVSPHDVSMILALMGEMPLQVLASSAHHLPHRTHDIASIELRFSRNRQAQIVSSWIHPVKEQKLTVIGDQAMAVFDDCLPWENKLRLFSQLHTLPAKTETVSLQPSEPLTNECKHFLDCILHNQTPKTGAQEALNVTRVLEAALHSARTSQAVVLPTETLGVSPSIKEDVLIEV